MVAAGSHYKFGTSKRLRLYMQSLPTSSRLYVLHKPERQEGSFPSLHLPIFTSSMHPSDRQPFGAHRNPTWRRRSPAPSSRLSPVASPAALVHCPLSLPHPVQQPGSPSSPRPAFSQPHHDPLSATPARPLSSPQGSSSALYPRFTTAEHPMYSVRQARFPIRQPQVCLVLQPDGSPVPFRQAPRSSAILEMTLIPACQ